MNDTNNYAENIATLTLDMEKVCRSKEVYFCNSINITPVEFKCLRYLLNNTVTQANEIANEMNVTASRVTNLLNSLEKKSYIKREISKKDRRIIKIILTSQGEKFAQDIQKKYIDFHKDILSNISDESQLKSLLSSLKNFQETLETFLDTHKNDKELIH